MGQTSHIGDVVAGGLAHLVSRWEGTLAGHAIVAFTAFAIAVLFVFAILSYRQRGRLIDELHRKKRLESDRQVILEMVARRRPPAVIFQRIARSIAVNCPGARAAVIRFLDGAVDVAPESPLPKGFISSLSIISAHSEDFDQLWRRLHDTAVHHGLNCHFCPIRSGGEELLGAIAVSWNPAKRRKLGIPIVSTMGNLAGAAIDNARLYERLAYQAGHDALTGLPNRLNFEATLHQEILQAGQSRREVAVFFLDLDRFKQINDSLGHRVGDLFLQQVALRVGGALPSDATLARIGGDEFTLLLRQRQDPLWAQQTAGDILTALKRPCKVGDHELFASASIGISLYPKDGADPVTLQKHADSAMYRAKASGKNRYEFFSADMSISTASALEVEPVVRGALDEGRFQLYYQPQFTMTGEFAGLEVLLRLDHPAWGIIGPGDFLALAEETGLILPIGEWVLREACSQFQRWQKRGLMIPKLAINISPVQVENVSFTGALGRILGETGINPECLELELTECCILSSPASSRAQLNNLKALGVNIAADHFGVTPSALTSIHRLPVHLMSCLKIDRSFTDALDAPVSTLPLVQAICTLAADIGMAVAVTGIERASQFERLSGVHRGNIQGYYFGKPQPAVEITRFLESGDWRGPEREVELVTGR